MNETILSPLTSKNNIAEAGSVKSEEIISIYKKQYDFDISEYFKGIEEVKIYKCLDTEYMFYYPFSTEGDEKYYARMSQFEWYYNPLRWEHTKAFELIEKGAKVLEVGSGSGFFINELKKREIRATGLELNSRGIKEAEKIGVTLLKETIQAHSGSNANTYDAVCSFQVLEHISQPLSFLESKIKCLKKGGKLIIGVPNNDSYLKDNKMDNKVLNMPPHHVGLWTLNSLKSLEKLFAIKLEDVYYEPMIGANVSVYVWNRVNSFFFGMTFFNRVFWKLKLDKLLTQMVLKNSAEVVGNSMVVVYTKNN